MTNYEKLDLLGLELSDYILENQENIKLELGEIIEDKELAYIFYQINCILEEMTSEERMEWFGKYQKNMMQPYEREVDGTVYHISSHLSGNSLETIAEKAERLIMKK